MRLTNSATCGRWTGQLTYADFSGFGLPVSGSRGGRPFGFSGGNGCVTDTDIDFVLMGHRYYDTRQGRFISQDPAGDGDNWYEYADNNPTNEIDPLGLVAQGGGFGLPGFSPDPSMSGIPFDGDDTTDDYNNGVPGTYNRYVNGKYVGTATIGPSLWDKMNNPMAGGAPAGMIAGGPALGDNIGNFIQAVAPNAPKKVVKVAAVISNVAAASAAAKSAAAALKYYSEKKAAANAWKLAGTATARGLARSLGVEALGGLGVAGLGVTAEVVFAATAGWETGKAISNAPLGPGGQTVTDYWADQLSNSGLWLQQHTSFGH